MTLTPVLRGTLLSHARQRRTLHARQVSPRGGELWCSRVGDRVLIAGNAVRFLDGTIMF